MSSLLFQPCLLHYPQCNSSTTSSAGDSACVLLVAANVAGSRDEEQLQQQQTCFSHSSLTHAEGNQQFPLMVQRPPVCRRWMWLDGRFNQEYKSQWRQWELHPHWRLQVCQLCLQTHLQTELQLTNHFFSLKTSFQQSVKSHRIVHYGVFSWLVCQISSLKPKDLQFKADIPPNILNIIIIYLKVLV